LLGQEQRNVLLVVLDDPVRGGLSALRSGAILLGGFCETA